MFQPKQSELSGNIGVILTQSIDILSKFNRLEHEMLNTRQKKIQELIEKQKETNKMPGMAGNEQLKFTVDNKFLIENRETIQSYKAKISSDVASLTNDIKLELENQSRKLNDCMNPWKNEQFRKVWSLAKEEYFKEMLKTMPAKNFREQIEFYENIQNDIKEEKTTTDILCIYVDTTKIREKIGGLIIDAQKKQLHKIKAASIAELDYFYNVFSTAYKELKDDPEDLYRLKEVMGKWEEYVEKKDQIETKITSSEELFKILDDYMESLSPEDSKRRIGLREAFEEFNHKLKDIKIRNDQSFATLRAIHNKKLEDFEKDIKENREYFSKNAPYKDCAIEDAFQLIDNFKETTDRFRQKEDDMTFGFELFKMNYSQSPDLVSVEDEIENLKMVWGKRREWNEKWDELKVITFYNIDTEEILEICQKFFKDIASWKNHIRGWGVTVDLKAEIEVLKSNMPIIDILRNPSIRDRHWEKIKGMTSEQFDQNGDYFNIEKIVELGFDKLLDKVSELWETAEEQYKIEQSLYHIKKKWNEQIIKVGVLANAGDIYVVKKESADEINDKLEEDMVKLASMKTNYYALEFEAEIEQWDNDLNKILETLDILIVVQRKFIYFNNIFMHIAAELNQMAGDYSNFTTVKNDFKIHLDRIEQNPYAKQSLTVDQFKERFTQMNKELDTIQKMLKSLLKLRRSKFSRFYFLSDEDMFEMLGKAKDPVVINKHLKKMFEGIKTMHAEERNIDRNLKMNKFTQMISPDGEKVILDDAIEINGDLIKLMDEIEKKMKDVLKSKLKASNAALLGITNPKLQFPNLESYIKETPGQIILLSVQIEWTQKCYSSIMRVSTALERGDKDNKNEPKDGKVKKNPQKEEWKEFKGRYEDYLKEIPKLMLTLADNVNKLKVIALIVVMVSNRDIINILADTCTSVSSFEWTKQLRYSTPPDEANVEQTTVTVNQGNADFKYAWEYQGNNGRLVITPLTDRCYLTLTIAMNLKRGGAPQGPAGTGKTETVKDLGKNLGIFVFIFNCSEGLEVQSLKGMFEGFARTGSWGCFDEFNRIEIEVLSVVAIYIKNILDALAITEGDYGIVNLDDDRMQLSIN